ncbi:hypothetical protein [Glaciihabitans sp. UYNi722]|uniref:hypothetical protein n=1 Tax=Glaciihabitans sp. UYNi722 TaxID=3156344 RepID=UPI0033956D4B
MTQDLTPLEALLVDAFGIYDGEMVAVSPITNTEGQKDTQTHWANGNLRLLTPEAYKRLNGRKETP